MKNTLALLLADGYKHVHAEQFPKGLTKLYSYLTPRKSRLKTQNKMMFFGLNGFCQEYLVDYFKENFFDLPLEEVIEEYTHVMDSMLGRGNYDVRKVIDLHKLGYLPLHIRGVAEGELVPMGVPCIEISNTRDEFAWVVQWVESLLSCEMWKPCIQANVGFSYRKVVDKFYDLTVDNNVDRRKAISDFGFRGMSSLQEATKASAAWLLSFSSTATIPAISYLEKYYHCNNTDKSVATNAISTEHAVMASNFSVDGDEKTFIKKLITEIYPNTGFSMVSDTYDYWNVVDNILPELKDLIEKHNGKILIRPDSGDIVDVSVETIKSLWNTFGGYVNTKGYKVLSPHIGCVYGDGVTQKRAEIIYTELMNLGFAANNIIFGAGSFSFNCIQEEDDNGELTLKPYTRDTFSVAVKATGGIVNGKFIEIYKDPKTDKDCGDNFKKSQRGCCFVSYENGELVYKDRLTESQYDFLKSSGNDAMVTYFMNGAVEPFQKKLYEIRELVEYNLRNKTL